MTGNFSFDEHAALEKIKAAAHAKIFKVKCPKCGLVAAVREGVTPCPRCGHLLKVELNIFNPDR